MIGAATTSRAIHRRLLLSGGLIVLLILAASVAATVLTISFIADLGQRTQAVLATDRAVEGLRAAIAEQETCAFDYAVAREPASLACIRDAQAEELLAYEHLGGIGVPANVSEAAGSVRDLASAWRTGWVEPFLAAVDTGSPGGGEAAKAARVRYDVPLMAALDELSARARADEDRAAGGLDGTVASMAVVLVPIVVLLLVLFVLTWVWVTRSVSDPLRRLNTRARQVVAGIDAPFVAERDDEIGELAEVLEGLRREATGRYQTARLEADRAAVFNQLAELISFAQDEEAVVAAAVRTLGRIAPSARGDVLLVNNSTNRLIVAAGWGEGAPAAGPAPIDRIDRCPGIRRATAYIAADLADDMAVRCPAHPASAGTVACVPMPALGTIVGVIHLERAEPHAFDAETVGVIARVAEQVALAIANARLMRTMEGLAMSDPLTGLRNPRFFDGFLEQELNEAERDHEPTTLLALDIDHFKQFNDTHGHPGGDEALRTFSRVLRSSVRSSDVIARYGGEEFVIALHRTATDDARIVAEKIRLAVEQAVVEIGPGRYARMTVSIGIATAEPGRLDPKSLVALADAALYRAKENGRNRVEFALPDDAGLVQAAARRLARHERPAPPVTRIRRGRGGRAAADEVPRAG